jgi:hypothetical protein
VTGETLRVIDAESRTLTGELELDESHGDVWYSEQMLLSGDHALVIGYGMVDIARSGVESFADIEMSYVPEGTRLVLVDLSGNPEVVGTMDLDGTYVDGRQVGSTARLVVRSGPRLDWTYPGEMYAPVPSTEGEAPSTEAEALAANRELVERSTIEDWLPRFVATDEAGERSDGLLVECEDVSHPREYSGTSMLTVVTLDLAGALEPHGSVTVVADGQTVYGTPESLYIAADHRGVPVPFDTLATRPFPVADPATEIHKFDVSEPGSPQYVASGRVDGWLLNQYSLSEYDGHLRVATTTEKWTDVAPPDDGVPPSESGVSVLAQRGNRLVEVGSVGGLGKGEQIFAVRFLGPVGYVVTFRQVDPLYTLDLSDPASPRVVGELKIPGYSAYLHPVEGDRLLGIGQNADEQGMTLGAQVSLFDVSDAADPTRLDTYALPESWTEAEHDPHAFLYWPADGLVVMPIWASPAFFGEPGTVPDPYAIAGGALVLRLEGDHLTEVGTLSHVRSDARAGYDHDPSIRRSLVVGETLWTVSSAGALASDLGDLDEQAWVPFSR